MQKHKAYFILGSICLLLGAGIGIGAVYYTINGNADARIAVANADFNRDRATLQGRINDAIGETRIAQESSASASRDLADYRKLVDQRERDRARRIDGIIGQAGQGGSGASEIADGLDGDIEIARSIEGRLDTIIEGLRGLQKSK